MRQIKTIFLLFILFSCAPIFASIQQSAAEKLSDLLNQFTTFQAQFTQETTNAQQQILERSSGVMMMERPNRFRFETNNPTHQIVLTDGHNLWVYDVDLQQATKQSISNSPINPAQLLSGNVNHLLKQFHVHMILHHTILVFELIPRKPNQAFRSIAMAFSHEKLQRMQIENNLEQTTVFDFSHIKLNAHLSPSLFEFKAPSGVDVLR